MPTPLPNSVRESWGEEVADDFSRWLDETLQQNFVTRDEYREILSRLDVLEERLDERFERVDDRFDHVYEHMEARFEKVDERFEQMDERFTRMEDRFESRFNSIENSIDEQGHQFNQRVDAVNERIDRLHNAMRVKTRGTIGTIALFGTIVTVFLAIAEFGG
jgi:hypothetical protein